MPYLFPIDLHYVSAVAKTDYPGDSGADIGAPVGTPVVAVGNGWIVYAEKGHTKWWPSAEHPNDTPNSVKIKLAQPIIRNGHAYPYVFYTHLSSFVLRTKGSWVKAGDLLGKTGTGRSVPHLHITFYDQIDGGGYIGNGADRLDDQKMMWDEWLPEQIKPQEESEEDMDFAFVPPTLDSGPTDYEFVGLDTGGDKKVWLDLRARTKNVPLELSVKIFPLSRQKIPSYKLMLPDEFPFVEELWHKVDGGFSVRVKSNGPKFAAAVKQGQ